MEAKTIGLSGRKGSLKQKTSANPLEASRRCGASVLVIRLEILRLTICIYVWVTYAGRSWLVRTENALAALSSSSGFVVALVGLAMKAWPKIGLKASAIALTYLIAFNALRGLR